MPMRTVTLQGKTGNSIFSVPEAWEPTRHLGAGAYAAVAAFRERRSDSTDGPEFAVKKVERVFDHPVLALRTLREIRLLAHLRHPNVLGLHGLFVNGPDFKDAYLCLEMMDGDLHQLIHGGKESLSDYQVQCVLYQIMRGLLCLRVAHVVHRDLKPGNILVKAGGDVKIADLGLARAIDAQDDDHDVSVLTEYVVTRYYRAPEVVLTATRYTYAVDVWSTGCILGEMLTRRPVFEGKDALDQIKKIMSVIGPQSLEEMSWIPKGGHSWNFVEKCNQKSGDKAAFQRLLASPGMNPVAMELLSCMLRFDPSKRITVDDALVHRYLGSFGAEEDPEVAAARAVPVTDWSFDRDLCFDEHGQPKRFDVKLFRKAFKDARGFAASQAVKEEPFRCQGASATVADRDDCEPPTFGAPTATAAAIVAPSYKK